MPISCSTWLSWGEKKFDCLHKFDYDPQINSFWNCLQIQVTFRSNMCLICGEFHDGLLSKALNNTFLFKMYNVQEWMKSTSVKICSICTIQCFTNTPLLYLLKYNLYVGKMAKWAKVPAAKLGKPNLIPRTTSCLTSQQTQRHIPLW